MFPEPFFSTTQYDHSLNEIRKFGFVADPFLSQPTLPRTFGFNFTMAWPLPESLRVAHDTLRTSLNRLDKGLYIYPHEDTHVTVATIVDFVNHIEPSEEEITRLRDLSEHIAERTRPLFQAYRSQDPLVLEFGPPLLSRNAIFIPAMESTGRVPMLRAHLAKQLESVKGLELKIPNIIHTTVARFQTTPTDLEGFMHAFENISKTTQLGFCVADEIVMAIETKPYLKDASISHHFPLELR